MLMSEDSDMIQLNNAAQYNVWKGQLYIHEQLVCNIALHATSAFGIPAQLPQKLELKEVIYLSELRTKLPEDVFQKTDFTGQEVSCGNIYYSFYPVITSDIIGSELDKLLKCLKDQDLALIKVLNDQGFLVLVSSAVFPNSTGIYDGNSAQLNALFLFPHQKVLDKEREEWEDKFIRKELPLTISTLLPGLHYAIVESCKLQKDKALYPGPLVEQYFRKYAVLQSKKDSLSEKKPEQKEPLSICHTDDLPKKCSQLAFSCLQLYFSSPVNFSVPLIKMSNIFSENTALSSNSDQCSKTLGNLVKQDSPSKRPRITGSKAVIDKLQERPATSQDKQQPKRNTKRKSVKRRGKKGKKKPDQRSALTSAETGENQTANKRRRLVSEGKEQKMSSSETTIKLVSAPFPQKRKRGAEVLSAAFIQDQRIQPTERISSSKPNEENDDLSKKTIPRKPRKTLPPEEHLPVSNRPSKRKASDPGNKNISAGFVNKPEVLRRTSERNSGKTVKNIKRSQEKIQNSTVVQTNPLSKSSDDLRYAKKSPLSAQISGDSMMEKRISMYESHALNLLADLALNSFGSTSIPYLETGNMASANESLVEEAASTGDTVRTVEHSQDCSLPTQSNVASSEPEPVFESESHKPKNSLHVSSRNIASQKRMETGEKQLSQKAHIAAAKAKARFNATSKICLEHSYSQLPIEDIPAKSTKEANEQPIQVAPDTTTPPEVVPEPSTNGLSGDLALSGESVCPAMDKKQREVSKFQDKFSITFHWEPVYDFDLDSKFTSDPLEKTVNRALHGPWNPHLKEKIEDVKIILHMWIALFYSKCNKPITNSSSRKVVEHSNPAKYVSINTVLDPFEFYEIMESDGAPSAENTNAILSMGKMSETPLEPDLSCKTGKSRNKNLQDLNIPSSIPTKDYNIKLASEIFQVCKDSESAFYSDSLQTSMTCRMPPTSQGAQTPANIMNIICGTNVPTVCYIGDTNLFNTELKDKSENCINIGGFSSEKARSKEIEHKYSRDFSSNNEAQKSADSQIKSSDVDKMEKSVKVGEKVRSGYTRLTYSDMMTICNLKMTPNVGASCKTTSKLEFAGKIVEYSCAESTTKDSANEGLPSVDLSKKDENAKDLDKEDVLSVHTLNRLDARMHRGVDNHRAAESQDLVQASALLPQELHDWSGGDESDSSPDDDTLPNSEDSQMAITSRFSAMGLNSPSHHSDVSTELAMDKSSNIVDPLLNEEASKCDRDSSAICPADTENLQTAGSPDTNVHSKSIPSEDNQVDGFTNSPSSLGPQKSQMEGLEFCKNPDVLKNVDSNMSIDDSNCTMEDKTDSAWDSAGFEERQEKAVENIPDELGDLVEPENTQKLNVLKAISATDLMSRLELSFSSDEESNMECTAKSYVTDHMKSGDQQTISESQKESSEKTVGHEELSTEENEISTSGEHSMPAGCRDNTVLPEKNPSVQETDVHEACHASGASMVDKAEMEVPEKPSLPLNIAQSCLSDGDADFPNVAATEEGTKKPEPEPSNRDDLINSDSLEGSLPEASEKEFPCTEEKPDSDNAVTSAEESHNGTCLDDLSSPGADKYVMDGVPSTSFLGDLDMDEEKLAESQNDPLISLAPSEGEKITDLINSVDPVNKEDDLSGLAVKEMQVDPDTLACHTVEKVSVSLSENTVDRNLDGSNENNLGSDITNSFSDLLMSKWSEMDLERPPMEKQQPDHTGDEDLSTTVKPTRTSAKDSTHSSRNSCSNKKEILSKLKRICLGSITSYQVSSGSEIVLPQDKTSINSSVTKELNEVIDESKNEAPREEESTLDNCDDVDEEPMIDNALQEESAITTVNSGEPESLEGVMPPQEDSLVLPSLEDVSDGIEQDPSPEQDSLLLPSLEDVSDGIEQDPSPEQGSLLLPSLEDVSDGIEQDPSPEQDSLLLPSLEDVSDGIEQDPSPEQDSLVLPSLEDVSDGIEQDPSPEQDSLVLPSLEDVSDSIEQDPSPEQDSLVLPSLEDVSDSIEQDPSPEQDSLVLPSLEDVSDSIEQDQSPELPDICFIVNTGSISKEQYDRWSETSDDDIEYIRSYKEPLPDQEYYQNETCHSEFLDKAKCSQDQTTTNRIEKISKKQPGLYEIEDSFSRDVEYNSSTNHENVIVTRNIKEADRALHTINKETTSRSDLNHIFSDRRMVSDDLTQNSLNMENVRFMCKLKEILRKSSTDKHSYGPPFQTVFESRRIPSCSRITPKSRSPLRVTVLCPYRRTDFRRHDSWHPNPYNSSPYYGDDLWDRPVTYSRTIRTVRTPRFSPFHFKRLRYENMLEKSPTDISGILNECVQSNHVKLSSIGLGGTAVDRTSAIQLPEEGGWQTRRKSVPVFSKSKAVKNVLSDLCTSLHSRLQSVARAPEQKIYFYIYETDDEDFISSTKSLLVKDGLVSTDPWEFLSSEHSESHQLLVIIKNEDVLSCINKIPCLRQLKLLPNVTFAGVDTPEDMIESSYEELFHAGGFVASDRSVLENITLGKLKDVLIVLEKMNRTSPWKWLIHYRENRKLKENKRAEAQYQTKLSLLKSYQQSNIIEILPYHQCDSRSKEPSNDLSCLLNLQYQHIHSRLAVYLTGTSSPVTEEYEQNGILVYDVDTFLRRIHKMDSQFQASYGS